MSKPEHELSPAERLTQQTQAERLRQALNALRRAEECPHDPATAELIDTLRWLLAYLKDPG